MDPEEVERRMRRYAQTRGWPAQDAVRLGFGIHGTVFAMNDNRGARRAVKFFSDATFFSREVIAYERLQELGISEILGFRIPSVLFHESAEMALELSIVTRPYLLDFAASRIDAPHEFPPEIVAEWHTDKAAQFGDRWPVVCRVVSALEDYGIYLTDISPSNIAFEIEPVDPAESRPR